MLKENYLKDVSLRINVFKFIITYLQAIVGIQRTYELTQFLLAMYGVTYYDDMK